MEINIGENIRKIREIKGFSQDYLASKLKISQRQYSRLENNETDITISKLLTVSDVLEVSPSQLLGFDEKLFFNQCSNGNFGNNGTYFAYSPKEQELYENHIRHLEAEIEFLRALT